MSKNFIISTTNNIEGCPIKKYIDVINTNVVVGTNVFSDIAASFTDFFGGKSSSYKNKLESISNDAKKELKQKALNIGANAIVGFKLDFDEISGKDKSMFMVSASGTACIIDYIQSNCIEKKELNQIDQQILDKEIIRRQTIADINHSKEIRNKWVEFLIENPQIEIIDSLLDIYTRCAFREMDKEELFKVTKILSVIPRESLLPKVYENYMKNSDAMSKLIRDCHLFDAKSVLSIFDTDMHLAINILDAKSEIYTREDLDAMLKIKAKIDSIPDLGKIEIVKSGLLGKEQEKFICPNGHKNNLDSKFCENDKCGLNIKGLTSDEVQKIDLFYEYVNIIQDLISPA